MDLGWADSPRLARANVRNKNSLRMGILQKAIWDDSGPLEAQLSLECQSACLGGRGQFATDAEISLIQSLQVDLGRTAQSTGYSQVGHCDPVAASQRYCTYRGNSTTGVTRPASLPGRLRSVGPRRWWRRGGGPSENHEHPDAERRPRGRE